MEPLPGRATRGRLAARRRRMHGAEVAHRVVSQLVCPRLLTLLLRWIRAGARPLGRRRAHVLEVSARPVRRAFRHACRFFAAVRE